jgi:arsenate reductase
MLFICYPVCSTCKRAREFLQENKIDYDFRDIKEQNPTVEELKDWQARSGLPLKKFFNTSGQLYRERNVRKRLPSLSEEEQFKLLATDGMLVKRPILIGDCFVLVGFHEAEWKLRLLSGARACCLDLR